MAGWGERGRAVGARAPDLAESLSLVRAAARGLTFAHARGIVHRDLKPSNLFLRRGRVDDVVCWTSASPATSAASTRSPASAPSSARPPTWRLAAAGTHAREAGVLADDAVAMLDRQAARIPDPELRDRFLAGVPENVGLLALARELGVR